MVSIRKTDDSSDSEAGEQTEEEEEEENPAEETTTEEITPPNYSTAEWVELLLTMEKPSLVRSHHVTLLT